MKSANGRKLTLIQSFTFASMVILLLSLAVTGWWVSQQITSQVINRVGHATSLFAGSVIAPYVLEMLSDGNGQMDLQSLMDQSRLGKEIVAFKVWGRGGKVLFSTNEVEVGQVFPIEAGLKSAWDGIVSAEMSDLNREEHEQQRKAADRLLETYSPVREPGTGRIVAVVEFYQSVDEFYRELRAARIQSWAIVSAVVLMIYLSLIMIVRRGSTTIIKQRDELEARVSEYRELLFANSELNRKINAAAERTTALNEQFLKRVAADLHDGPAQDIGYSLLMIDSIAGSSDEPSREDTKKALDRALHGIRDVSAGLRLPDLEELELHQVVDRAVRIHSLRSKGSPSVEVIRCNAHSIGLAAKITVFRVIQEALSNAFKHAGDPNPAVRVTCDDNMIHVRVADRGPGFEASKKENQGMGLSIMRERVELLGGVFNIDLDLKSGTTITAAIPISGAGNEYE